MLSRTDWTRALVGQDNATLTCVAGALARHDRPDSAHISTGQDRTRSVLQALQGGSPAIAVCSI